MDDYYSLLLKMREICEAREVSFVAAMSDVIRQWLVLNAPAEQNPNTDSVRSLYSRSET